MYFVISDKTGKDLRYQQQEPASYITHVGIFSLPRQLIDQWKYRPGIG